MKFFRKGGVLLALGGLMAIAGVSSAFGFANKAKVDASQLQETISLVNDSKVDFSYEDITSNSKLTSYLCGDEYGVISKVRGYSFQPKFFEKPFVDNNGFTSYVDAGYSNWWLRFIFETENRNFDSFAGTKITVKGQITGFKSVNATAFDGSYVGLNQSSYDDPVLVKQNVTADGNFELDLVLNENYEGSFAINCRGNDFFSLTIKEIVFSGLPYNPEANNYLKTKEDLTLSNETLVNFRDEQLITNNGIDLVNFVEGDKFGLIDGVKVENLNTESPTINTNGYTSKVIPSLNKWNMRIDFTNENLHSYNLNGAKMVFVFNISNYGGETLGDYGLVEFKALNDAGEVGAKIRKEFNSNGALTLEYNFFKAFHQGVVMTFNGNADYTVTLKTMRIEDVYVRTGLSFYASYTDNQDSTFTIEKVGLRFGATLTVEDYNALTANKTKDIHVTVNNGTLSVPFNRALVPATLDANGDVTEVETDIAYYQFALVIVIQPDDVDALTTSISAQINTDVCKLEVSKTMSVKDLVNSYITDYADVPSVSEHLPLLKYMAANSFGLVA